MTKGIRSGYIDCPMRFSELIRLLLTTALCVSGVAGAGGPGLHALADLREDGSKAALDKLTSAEAAPQGVAVSRQLPHHHDALHCDFTSNRPRSVQLQLGLAFIAEPLTVTPLTPAVLHQADPKRAGSPPCRLLAGSRLSRAPPLR